MNFKEFRDKVARGAVCGCPPSFIIPFIIKKNKEPKDSKLLNTMIKIQYMMPIVTFAFFWFAIPYVIAKHCFHKDQHKAPIIIGLAVAAVLLLALWGASNVITKLTEPEIFSNRENKAEDHTDDVIKNFLFLCGILCPPTTLFGAAMWEIDQCVTRRNSAQL